jgi:hypothetical protein
MSFFEKNWKREEHEILHVGDIVEVVDPGAHLPMAKKLAELRHAHWRSGIIAIEEYKYQKFEILAILDDDPINPVCHIIVADAIEKKKAGWKRTEFFIGGRGLQKVKSCSFLGMPNSLFEI